MPEPPQSGSTPDSLFAAWLARHEAGEEADFGEVCRQHPQEAGRLRALHAHWAELEQIRRQHGLGGSLSEKLKTQYGSGVDPVLSRNTVGSGSTRDCSWSGSLVVAEGLVEVEVEHY